MSDNGVMTTPIFDELISEFGGDLADGGPETSEDHGEPEEVGT